MWKMLHEANAIEAMAVNIRFFEPAGNVIVKRMIREVERNASKHGLIDRQPLQSFQVDIMNPGQVRPIQNGGVLFQRNSLTKIPTGEVEQQLAQQVDVQPTHVTYQTWRYTRWQKELEMMSQLIFGAIAAATSAVTVAAIRLEYIDRFLFDGDVSKFSIQGLIHDKAGWITPRVVEDNSLWHSHAGRFSYSDNERRRLNVLNLDSQELSGPAYLAGRRSILMLTGVEDQFPRPGKEIDGDNLHGFLSDTLSDLHSESHSLFKGVIDVDFAKANGLPHD